MKIVINIYTGSEHRQEEIVCDRITIVDRLFDERVFSWDDEKSRLADNFEEVESIP
jgi:hypothetical protein